MVHIWAAFQWDLKIFFVFSLHLHYVFLAANALARLHGCDEPVWALAAHQSHLNEWAMFSWSGLNIRNLTWHFALFMAVFDCTVVIRKYTDG